MFILYCQKNKKQFETVKILQFFKIKLSNSSQILKNKRKTCPGGQVLKLWLCYMCNSRTELLEIGQEINKVKLKMGAFKTISPINCEDMIQNTIFKNVYLSD